MRRLSLLIGLLTLPALALALDYDKSSERYTDAPFSVGDAAGISVLTNLGAVSGNPDGTFAADRSVNRAEFLKIAFLSRQGISVIDDDSADCFPDVNSGDWFSKYVCLAKRRGDVGGYPDGFFRPGNAVNYVEALKMLGELYGLSAPDAPAEPWYMQYVEAAREAELLLPISIEYDAPLTRGQVARLAASFRAHSEGELDLYRQLERGNIPFRSSSSPASRSSQRSEVGSSSSISSSSSLSSASSSSSSSSSSVSMEVRSHFLLLGKTTPLLVDGLFTSETEDALVRSAELELFASVDSIDTMILLDPAGNQIMELTRRGTGDELEKQFEGTASEASAYRMPKGQNVRLGLKAKLKPQSSGGGSNEMFELYSWSVRLQGVESGTYYQPAMLDEHKPPHQTALGRITSVTNTVGSAISVTQGMNKLLGTFRVTAETLTGVTLTIKEANFLLETNAVNLSRPRIGGVHAAEQQDCATERATVVRITCPVIPESRSVLSSGSGSVSLYGDLELQSGSDNGSIRIIPDGRGGIGSFGALRWTDGGGTFTWIEFDVPLESGPLVTVTK